MSTALRARARERRRSASSRGLSSEPAQVTEARGRDRGDHRPRLWRDLTDRGWDSLVPAATLSEIITGGSRDAHVNRLITAIGDVAADDEPIGRLAGALRSRAIGRARPSGVDALVAAHAASRRPAVVLTGDTEDLTALLANTKEVAVITV